jgi:hypothetical protein
MKDKEKFKNIVKDNEEKHGDEVRAKYGEKAFDKTKNWKPEQFKAVFEERERITVELVNLIKSGKKPTDIDVQKVIERHYGVMCKFSDFTFEAYKNLGRMYVDDVRFTENIDKALPRLARFMCEAMGVFVDQKIK